MSLSFLRGVLIKIQVSFCDGMLSGLGFGEVIKRLKSWKTRHVQLFFESGGRGCFREPCS